MLHSSGVINCRLAKPIFDIDSWVYSAKGVWTEQSGAEGMATFTLFSAEAMQEFANNASALFGGFDLLWVGLAVVAAWRTVQD